MTYQLDQLVPLLRVPPIHHGLTAKLKYRISTLLDNGEFFINHSGNNWSKLPSELAFPYNTNENYTSVPTLYEIVFGTKPQIPMTLKLGLSGFKNKQWKSEFCDGVQSHTQSANNLLNISISRLLRPQLSAELLER